MTNPTIGTVIDGRYRILSCLGEGATGAVYKALQTDISRQVALKSVHYFRQDDEGQYLRFQREAKILAGLLHENIVCVYAFISCPEMPACLVMEYVDGETLSQVISNKKTLSQARTINIAIQICNALEYAHAAGIVHRDLKPQNLMVCQTPRPDFVKILDFGLSRLVDADASQVEKLTLTGELVGTLQYMSPEQCKGEAVDARSDIYSLGCLLYECVSGGPPFPEKEPIALLHLQRHEWPARLSTMQACSKISREFELVIFKCFQKEPSDRFQSAKELREALEHIQDGTPGKIDFGKIDLGSPSQKQTMALPAIILFLLVLVTGAFYLVFSSMTKVSSDEFFSNVRSTTRNKEQSASGSPERRLLSLCADNVPAQPGAVNEIESLLPSFKGKPHILRFAYMRKGLFESALGKIGAARSSYILALNAEPQKTVRDVEAEQLLAAIAQTSLTLNDLDKAEECAEKVLAQAESKKAVESEVDNSPRAMLFFRLSRDPCTQACRVIALVAFRRHDYQRAERFIREAIGREKTYWIRDVDSVVLLADSCQKRGNHKQALKEIDVLLKPVGILDPSSFEAKARKRFVVGSVPGLSSYAERVAVAVPIINGNRAAGKWCIENGERERGLAYLKKALEYSRKEDEENGVEPSDLTKSLTRELKEYEHPGRKNGS